MLSGCGHIIDGAELRSHHSALCGGLFLHNGQLGILLLDGVDSISVLFAKGLVLVVSNTMGCWLNVWMVRSLLKSGVVDNNLLSVVLVVFDSFADVHGLVKLLNLVLVAQSGVQLVLDDIFHACLQLIHLWVHELVFFLDLLYAESSHSNEFSKEPLIGVL